MLTGFMDLCWCSRTLLTMLDYKSNKLPGYDPAQPAAGHTGAPLRRAVHRVLLAAMLKSRLATRYDRHVAARCTCFLRGIDQSGAGFT